MRRSIQRDAWRHPAREEERETLLRDPDQAKTTKTRERMVSKGLTVSATRTAGAAKARVARAVGAARPAAATRGPLSLTTTRRATTVREGKGCSVAAPQALGVNELALLAEVPESQVNEIFRSAGVIFGITLVGLAFGFLLLRVESIVEK